MTQTPTYYQRQPKSNILASSTQIQAKFEQAVALHQAHRLVEAEKIYLKILKSQPQHADSLHLLGVIEMQAKNFERALYLIDKAIAYDANNADSHYNRGIVLQELKQLPAAIASYDQAIKLNPNFTHAYYNLGLALQELAHYEQALTCFEQVIRFSPDFVEAYNSRGIALHKLKQLDTALESYAVAISINPHYAKAYYNRGLVLMDLKQLDVALASYDSAIRLNPNYVEAFNNRGVVLRGLNQLSEALAYFDKALALNPEFAEAYYNRSLVFQAQKQLEAALIDCNRAIALHPCFVEAYSNRGLVLHELKQFDAAQESYHHALTLNPNFAEAYCNRGLLWHELRQLDKALDDYNQAIAIAPNYAETYWNKALTLLLLGRFNEGWPLYEWRWLSGKIVAEPRIFSQPLWLGDAPLEDKTLLLHSEQGLGDTLQFCRYAKLVKAQGARVILEAQKPLLALLASLAEIDQLVAVGDPLPQFDYHCPLMSLPFAFQTNFETVPAYTHYLRSDPDKRRFWQAILGEKSKPRVGLVWSGNPTQTNDQNRSFELSQLLPYLPNDCEYVALQKDLRTIDKETLENNSHIRQYSEQLNDFSDTAALCELMDVTISVCTSVAHLAGALGKPLWVMLPYVPDWRWFLDSADSPWYPSAKLYRQQTIADWSSVFEKIHSDLEQLANNRVRE